MNNNEVNYFQRRQFPFTTKNKFKIIVKDGFSKNDNTHIQKCFAKGQIISKCLFGVFNFLQKTNEKKLT